MDVELNDLCEQAAGLRRRIAAMPTLAADPDVAAVASMLDTALEPSDGVEPRPLDLIAAIESFHELPIERQEALLNGWWPKPDRPTRADLIGALALASIRRTLSISLTARTIMPEHRFAFCDGDSPVRVEIQEGTTRREVVRALKYALGSIERLDWRYWVGPDDAGCLAEAYAQVDLRQAQAGNLQAALPERYRTSG
ncbi:MAG TPA: hypothetical protein VFC78_18295 [Tepidisphaeraceae bacterium]|nr:hypothetical protein [Tepidisphaeraceae bacterium]